MVTVNGERKFFPGTLGTLAVRKLDGESANLDSPIKNDSHILIEAGHDGETPEITLSDLLTEAPEYTIYVNGREKHLRQQIMVNGEAAEPARQLKDSDVIESKEPKTLGEALRAAG